MELIPILFEDEAILVVNKPAGLPTQGTRDPRRPHVLGLLQEQTGRTLYLHHRLDKDTSGVLVFGKDPRANKPLTEIFRDHRARKQYLALSKINTGAVHPLPTEFSVNVHLAPVRGAKGVERMVVVKSGGWSSETDFRVLWSSAEQVLTLCAPKTGRTHQLRVHLAHRRLPILGDFLYGGKSPLVPRLMLHALCLEIPHPLSGAPLRLEAPLAKDFASVLSRLGADWPVTGAKIP